MAQLIIAVVNAVATITVAVVTYVCEEQDSSD